jgi:hypothetical protein
LCVDDIDAAFPDLDQLDADRRRILQVGVHHDHGIRLCGGIEARGDRDLVAAVARQAQDGDPRISGAQAEQAIQRGVLAAVVDVDELEVEVGAARGRRDQCLMEDRDVRCFFEDRQYVGDGTAFSWWSHRG